MTAQLEAYLLNLYQRKGGQIVKASPTFMPQTVNSLLRLEEHVNNQRSPLRPDSDQTSEKLQ
jgi:hypothetical protein